MQLVIYISRKITSWIVQTHPKIAFHFFIKINFYIIETVCCSSTFNATVEVDVLMQTTERGKKKNCLKPRVWERAQRWHTRLCFCSGNSLITLEYGSVREVKHSNDVAVKWHFHKLTMWRTASHVPPCCLLLSSILCFCPSLLLLNWPGWSRFNLTPDNSKKFFSCFIWVC